MAANKDESDLERLRILVSDGKGHRLEEVTHTVTSLGHEVVGHSSLGDVAASTASIRPDAAIVIVGESSEHALELIGRSVTEAACPVIAILDVEDEAFIRDAAKRGIFAYITLGRASSALQSSLDMVLSRFAEYQGLEGAFARRAVTERAQRHPDGAALGRRPTGVRDAPRRGTPHEPQAHRGCGGGHTERPSPSQVAR
jgi:AmiR/NasT family two-component response regulator